MYLAHLTIFIRLLWVDMNFILVLLCCFIILFDVILTVFFVYNVIIFLQVMESINYVVVSRVYYQLHTSTEYV